MTQVLDTRSEVLAAARAQFAAEMADSDRPDGMNALYEELQQRSAYERILLEKREALAKTLRRATNQNTITKTNRELDHTIESFDLNKRAIDKVREQLDAMRAERDAARREVSNAFLVELLSDFGKVQFGNEDHPTMPTHVEITPTGPFSDGNTYAIVVRGSRGGYGFEVGLRGGEGERYLAFDVDVSGPRAQLFGKDDETEPSKVNWPAMGSQPVATVKQFAKVLDIAAQLAGLLDEYLLPQD